MGTDLIRKIDRWIGQPICWLLSLICRVGRALRRRPTDEPPRKILFIKLIEQGSTILACRAFEAASKLVGQDSIYILVFDSNRPILDLLGYFRPENIFTLRDDTLLRFLMDALRVLRRVRRAGIDTTIDMEGFARAPVILAFLTGAKRRVGFHRFTTEGPYRGRLLTHELTYNFYLHTSLTFLSLVEALTAPPGEVPMLKRRLDEVDHRPPPFRPTPEEQEQMRQRLRRLGQRDVRRPIVLLNPNASDLLPLRRWPSDRFLDLGRRILLEHPEVTLAITGASAEREAAQALTAAIDPDRVLCLAGETTLRELLVLYTLSDILVTNDSGPVHFATLTDIHVIALFGPESPTLYRPLSPRATTIWAGLACSPCVNVFNHRHSPCRDNQCMQAISVAEVLHAVNSILLTSHAHLPS